MFELIGFWGAVTVILAPTLLGIWYLAEKVINYEVKEITKNKHGFKPFENWWLESVWRPSYRNDAELLVIFGTIGAVIGSASVLVIAATGGMVDCTTRQSLPFIEAISNTALSITPVTTYVMTPVLLFVGYRLTIRKALVKLFGLAEKVKNL